MNLGDKIKELRIKRGMKQSDLAEKANISRVSVGNYERNDRIPNANILIKISKALDVDPVELLMDTGSMDELDNLVNHFENGFDTVLYNIGYKIEMLNNGCRKLTCVDGREFTLHENEYNTIIQEINSYIRYVLTKFLDEADKDE